MATCECGAEMREREGKTTRWMECSKGPEGCTFEMDRYWEADPRAAARIVAAQREQVYRENWVTQQIAIGNNL